jgi:DNA repair exonuclease SbcCD ATPase subunit
LLQSQIRIELRNDLIARGLGDQIAEPTVPLDSCDVFLRTACFEAILKVVESHDDVDQTWRKWQNLIADYRRSHSELPRDCYLVLIIAAGNSSLTPSLLEGITRDTFVCRKFPVLLQDGDLAHALDGLPFLTYEAAKQQDWVTLENILEALKNKGYPSYLLDLMGQRIAPQRALESILATTAPQSVPVLDLKEWQKTAITQPRLTEQRSRLKHLAIRNFRGLRHLDLDLSSNLVVIYGRNGSGKTSIVDAIEWTLLGEVHRLAQESEDDLSPRSPYVNLLSENGTASAELLVSAPSGSFAIARSTNIDHFSTLQLNGNSIPDEHSFLDELIGRNAETLDLRILKRVLKTTVFLAQDTIRAFLSEKPDVRYASVAYLLGTQDYIRYLDKLGSVAELAETSAEEWQRKGEGLRSEVDDLEKQIKARRIVINQLPLGQSLIRNLREDISVIRQVLSDLESQIRGAVPARVENYEDVRIFTGILKQWVETAKRDANVESERISSAARALEAIPTREKTLADLSGQLRTVTEDLESETRRVDDLAKARDQLNLRLAQIVATRERRDKEANILQNARLAVREWAALKEVSEKQDSLLRQISDRLKTEQVGKDKRTESLQNLHGDLQTTIAHVHTVDSIQNKFAEAEKRFSEWMEAKRAQSTLEQKLETLDKDLRTIQEEREKAATSQANVLMDRDLVAVRLQKERSSLEAMHRLLSEVNEFVRHPDCPLCGHDWGQVEKLREQIASRLEWVSPELADLSATYQSLRENNDRLLDQVQTLNHRLKQTESERQTILKHLAATENVSSAFRRACEDLGLVPSELTDREQLKFRREDRERELSQLRLRKNTLEEQISELSRQDLESHTQLERLEVEVQDLREKIANTEIMAEQLRRTISDAGLATPETSLEELQRRMDLHTQEREVDNKRRQQYQVQLAELESSHSQVKARQDNVARKKVDLQTQHERTSLELQTLRSVLSQAGMPTGAGPDVLEQYKARTKERLQRLDRLELMASNVDRLSSWLITERDIQALEKQKTERQEQLTDIDQETERRGTWGRQLRGLAAAILAMRGQIENWKLEHYGPLINILYRRLLSHPLFQGIRTTVDPEKQVLKIHIEINPDILQGLKFPATELAPSRYLSEAQLNILAISMFLTNALQQQWARLCPIVMDDPVQNMDDFNANAFVDTLRAFTERDKQFIITTCDINFYKLLLLKLKCMNQGKQKRFSAFRLEGGTMEGPRKIEDL